MKTNLKCYPGYQTWTDTAGDNESRPINCLDWFTAAAFCAWDGGRLATEAEWNYAASGGNEQRYYPWSSPATSKTIDASYASYYLGSSQQCMGDGIAGCTLADLIVVGSKPAGNGKWGQADLAGNVWEWTLDWYDFLYPNPCDNCAGLSSAYNRVLRSGSFQVEALNLRSALRMASDPLGHSYSVGARCARTGL